LIGSGIHQGGAMSDHPFANVDPNDDVPAEVPDFVEPGDLPVEPTPLDEDTSVSDAASLAELQALEGEDE
jgi:hypothetical protein